MLILSENLKVFVVGTCSLLRGSIVSGAAFRGLGGTQESRPRHLMLYCNIFNLVYKFKYTSV